PAYRVGLERHAADVADDPGVRRPGDGRDRGERAEPAYRETDRAHGERRRRPATGDVAGDDQHECAADGELGAGAVEHPSPAGADGCAPPQSFAGRRPSRYEVWSPAKAPAAATATTSARFGVPPAANTPAVMTTLS